MNLTVCEMFEILLLLPMEKFSMRSRGSIKSQVRNIGHRGKRREICYSGTRVPHVYKLFELVVFKIILSYSIRLS